MNECAKASRTKNILSNQSPGRQSPVAAGEITFKGYGRGAAAMTPLDAARLLIAVTGSTFAKDAMTVLANFVKLTSLKARARQTTLGVFLGERIAAMPGERHFPTALSGRSPKRYSTDRQRSVGVKKSFGNAPGNVSVTARLGSS
jgi:hypothetical protein